MVKQQKNVRTSYKTADKPKKVNCCSVLRTIEAHRCRKNEPLDRRMLTNISWTTSTTLWQCPFRQCTERKTSTVAYYTRVHRKEARRTPTKNQHTRAVQVLVSPWSWFEAEWQQTISSQAAIYQSTFDLLETWAIIILTYQRCSKRAMEEQWSQHSRVSWHLELDMVRSKGTTMVLFSPQHQNKLCVGESQSFRPEIILSTVQQRIV
jgi:hypothetical protein